MTFRSCENREFCIPHKDARAKGLIGVSESETVTYVWLAARTPNA
jgi:hypothetical protein